MRVKHSPHFDKAQKQTNMRPYGSDRPEHSSEDLTAKHVPSTYSTVVGVLLIYGKTTSAFTCSLQLASYSNNPQQLKVKRTRDE